MIRLLDNLKERTVIQIDIYSGAYRAALKGLCLKKVHTSYFRLLLLFFRRFFRQYTYTCMFSLASTFRWRGNR